MKIWLVVRKDDVDYDEYKGFVVRARGKISAIRIAEKISGDETYTKGVWRASLVTPAGKPGVIMDSFKAG